MLTRKLLALVFPEGVFLLVTAALVHWGTIFPAMAPVVRLSPLLILIAGVLLGWRFQRGRLLLALLGLVVADRAMLWLAPFDSDGPHAGPVIVRVVAILLPVSFAALAFLDERGVRSEAGLRRLAVLGAETVAVLALWMLAAAYPANIAHAFDVALLPLPALLLGQPATFVALVAIGASDARPGGRMPRAGFARAAIGSVIAAAAGPANGRATLYLTTAGLVLVVAMVESAYAMAYHDELTGLPARRALNDVLRRAAGTYTVAMVDVDHFKKFNDTHGHDVGDQVLRMVAGRLGRVAGGGRAFRYGGEEFAVLFTGKSAAESAPHLEALRASVAAASFALRGKDRPRRKPKSPKRAECRRETAQRDSEHRRGRGTRCRAAGRRGEGGGQGALSRQGRRAQSRRGVIVARGRRDTSHGAGRRGSCHWCERLRLGLRRLGVGLRLCALVLRGLVLVAHELARHRVDVDFVDAGLAGDLHVEAVDQLSAFAFDLARLDRGVRNRAQCHRACVGHRHLRFLLQLGLRLRLLVVPGLLCARHGGGEDEGGDGKDCLDVHAASRMTSGGILRSSFRTRRARRRCALEPGRALRIH